MYDTSESRHARIERNRIESVIARIMDVLETEGVVMPTPHTHHAVRAELRRMYDAGRNDAVNDLMSMKDLQLIFPDTSRRYLQDLRKRLDLGIRVGSDQIWVYTPDDVARLREYMATDQRRKP